MSKFEVKLNKTADQCYVKVSGTIDEDIDFTPYSLMGCGSIDIDLIQVKAINSCGIREWIKWIETAGKSGLTFSNCPKVIVDQINMVDGFLPSNAKVQSFFVPYYHEESGSEKSVLFVDGTNYSDGVLKAPASVKDDAGNEMEMDVIEAKYFKFLKR